MIKRFVYHVRSQPDHIREFWAGLFTIISVIIVGTIWFRSFEHNVYALLNPEEAPAGETNYFAGAGSLFSSIGDAIKNGKAQIQSLAGGSSQKTEEPKNTEQPKAPAVYTLPLSGNR